MKSRILQRYFLRFPSKIKIIVEWSIYKFNLRDWQLTTTSRTLRRRFPNWWKTTFFCARRLSDTESKGRQMQVLLRVHLNGFIWNLCFPWLRGWNQIIRDNVRVYITIDIRVDRIENVVVWISIVFVQMKIATVTIMSCEWVILLQICPIFHF